MQDNLNLNNVKPIANPTTPIPTMGPNDFTALGYRVENIERQIQQLQGQLHLYVPQRENELQLSGIQNSVRRIEDDVAEIRKQISDMVTKMAEQEKEAQNRDVQQQKSQDQLQIRVLWFILASILAIGSTVLASYIIHLF